MRRRLREDDSLGERASRRTTPSSRQSSGCSSLDGYTDPSSVELRQAASGSVRGESASTTATRPKTGKHDERPEQDTCTSEVAGEDQGLRRPRGRRLLPGARGRLAQARSRTPTRCRSTARASSARSASPTTTTCTNGPGAPTPSTCPPSRAKAHASPDDIRPDNIRAVGVIFACVPARAAAAVRGGRPDRGDVVERPAPDRHGRRQQGARRLLLVERVPPQRLGAAHAVQPRPRCRRAARSRPRCSRTRSSTTSGCASSQASPSTTGSSASSDIVSGQRTSALTLHGRGRPARRRATSPRTRRCTAGAARSSPPRRLAKHVQTSFDILNNAGHPGRVRRRRARTR